MIDRIPFHVEHLNLLKSDDEYKDSLLSFDHVRAVLANLPGSPKADAVTFMCDGRVFACMGFWTISPGVVEVWLFPSIYVREHPIPFVRTVTNYIDALAKTFDWHRVQTVTKMDSKHRDWMKTLGFVEEGVMKAFYKKQDFVMSARYIGV